MKHKIKFHEFLNKEGLYLINNSTSNEVDIELFLIFKEEDKWRWCDYPVLRYTSPMKESELKENKFFYIGKEEDFLTKE